MYVCTVLAKGRLPAAGDGELRAVFEENATKVLESRSLGPRATDYVLDRCSAELKQQLYAVGARLDVDTVMQPEATRRKKLVVFDMDSTLIQHEVIDMIAAYAGVEDQVSRVTEAAMRGELDFSESLRERVALLKGVPASVYDDLKGKINLTPGAQELCRVLKQNQVKLAVLSGGFLPLAEWLKGELGLDYAYANVLETDGNTLSGRTTGPVVNAEKKAELLEEIAKKENVPLEYALAVGDGSNDLKMMDKAGFGIAFCAKPLVQQKAPSRLNTGNLADILFILGYAPYSHAGASR